MIGGTAIGGLVCASGEELPREQPAIVLTTPPRGSGPLDGSTGVSPDASSSGSRVIAEWTNDLQSELDDVQDSCGTRYTLVCAQHGCIVVEDGDFRDTVRRNPVGVVRRLTVAFLQLPFEWDPCLSAWADTFATFQRFQTGLEEYHQCLVLGDATAAEGAFREEAAQLCGFPAR